jgi:transcription elongation factor S-II
MVKGFLCEISVEDSSLHDRLLNISKSKEMDKLIGDWFDLKGKKRKLSQDKENLVKSGSSNEVCSDGKGLCTDEKNYSQCAGNSKSTGNELINNKGGSNSHGFVNKTTNKGASDSILNIGSSNNPKIINEYLINDKTRDKCISLLYEAIISNIENVDYERAAYISREMEAQMYSDGKIGDGKYIRSRILNLKDRSNSVLCERIYKGVISVKEFARMSVDEMKSERLREEEKKIMKESLLDSTVSKKEAETDLFLCGKCKQRKCSYRQVQTRSADEPMTTYVYCVCGNTWKFS